MELINSEIIFSFNISFTELVLLRLKVSQMVSFGIWLFLFNPSFLIIDLSQLWWRRIRPPRQIAAAGWAVVRYNSGNLGRNLHCTAYCDLFHSSLKHYIWHNGQVILDWQSLSISWTLQLDLCREHLGKCPLFVCLQVK